jgi:drug/metabolite transporter (DMT)-like permease
MQNAHRPPAWQTLLAFAIIYLVWGTTFLAIRIGVHEVSPFLFAAMRFLIAGGVLFGWTLAQGDKFPTARQWVSAFIVAFLIFVMDYGLLFWAEQRVPSGLAAVMLATIPAFTALFEILVLRTQKLTASLAAALLIGLCGVGVLTSRSLNLGSEPINRAGAAALLVASVSWSIATVLTRKLPMPPSKVMNSGAQMLSGGILLALSAAGLGEFRTFHPTAISRGAWLALLYLVVAGSIAGFTAYIWLIHHESLTKVGTYAYVNPVVAVFVGYLLAGESLGPRTLLGAFFVLTSVIMIAMASAKRQAAASSATSARASALET